MRSSIWHPFTQHALASDPLHVSKAFGAYLYDREGQRVIDAISSWWVITHGHCHPEIIGSVQEQAALLDQVIFAGCTHGPAEELACLLLEITGGNFDYVFYSDSGSTSVEVALKMAAGYWTHTGTPRTKILAFEGGYHGDTFGAMSVGGRSVYNSLYEPYLFDVEHIKLPIFGQEDIALEQLENLLLQHNNGVAAFIFEPLVLGAGGMVMYSAEILKKIVDLCRTYGVLIIADEVMTGFGRTGTVFACEQAGFTPDILCLSKGLTGGVLPMGATLCTGRIYDAFYHKDKSKTFFHSSSFTGNPMACAAATANLKLWKEGSVKKRISDIADIHSQAAIEFSRREDVWNVRQKGTILAMDVIAPDGGYLSELQPRLYDSFLSQKVLLRPLGNTVYILPPYCVTKTDLEQIYECIHVALDGIRDEGKKRAL